MRPASALREAAGYADRPADFDELMDMLDNELRMVTPVDPSARRADRVPEPAPPPARRAGLRRRAAIELLGRGPGPPRREAYYQLTHDYLVPPVRQWLTRKQRETRRGRAELRLAAITALWRRPPRVAPAPSMWEWLMIVGLTSSGGWSDDERRMMRAATRHHLLRAAAAVLIAGALVWSVVAIRDRERARGLLTAAITADYQHLAGDQLPELEAHRDALRPALLTLESDEKAERAPPRRRPHPPLPRPADGGARGGPARTADVRAGPAGGGRGHPRRAGGPPGGGRGRRAATDPPGRVGRSRRAAPRRLRAAGPASRASPTGRP